MGFRRFMGVISSLGLGFGVDIRLYSSSILTSGGPWKNHAQHVGWKTCVESS